MSMSPESANIQPQEHEPRSEAQMNFQTRMIMHLVGALQEEHLITKEQQHKEPLAWSSGEASMAELLSDFFDKEAGKEMLERYKKDFPDDTPFNELADAVSKDSVPLTSLLLETEKAFYAHCKVENMKELYDKFHK